MDLAEGRRGSRAGRECEKLIGERPSFKEFLTAPGPSLKGLKLTRDRSPTRDVKL